MTSSLGCLAECGPRLNYPDEGYGCKGELGLTVKLNIIVYIIEDLTTPEAKILGKVLVSIMTVYSRVSDYVTPHRPFPCVNSEALE